MEGIVKGSFGEILARYRKKGNFTQEEIANPELKLSASHIALLESSGSEKEAKSPRSRKQVWHLVEKLKIFPPDLDDFLEAAGQTVLRDEEEELFIQRHYPDLKELWIFAKIIRDFDEKWYETVKYNICERENAEGIKVGVKYCYFTSDEKTCSDLVEQLLNDGCPEETITNNIECFLLPDEFFLNNFAIYNPSEKNLSMYGCGGIAIQGKAFSFYTCERSEALYFFKTLKYLKQRILKNQQIALRDARFIQFPVNDSPAKVSRSRFTQRKEY
ncbi:hypothetical protein BH20ACI2_BH20ACI2_02160 [soil metagenome]